MISSRMNLISLHRYCTVFTSFLVHQICVSATFHLKWDVNFSFFSLQLHKFCIMAFIIIPSKNCQSICMSYAFFKLFCFVFISLWFLFISFNWFPSLKKHLRGWESSVESVEHVLCVTGSKRNEAISKRKYLCMVCCIFLCERNIYLNE